MSINIQQTTLSYLSVVGQTVPPEGPRGIPLALDFTVTNEYILNLQNVQSRQFFSMLQAVWIDNSQNPSPITVSLPQSGQNIILEAGEQGYVNVLCPNPTLITFSSLGNVKGVFVELLNYPVTNAVWQTGTQGDSVTSMVTYSGGLVEPDMVPNYSLTGAVTATVSPLLTPTTGYYIGGFAVFLTSNSTLTAGTDLQVQLSDSVSGVIAQVNLSPANSIFSAALGLFWNNKTSGSILSLILSTTLSAGDLYYTVPYGLSDWVG